MQTSFSVYFKNARESENVANYSTANAVYFTFLVYFTAFLIAVGYIKYHATKNVTGGIHGLFYRQYVNLSGGTGTTTRNTCRYRSNMSIVTQSRTPEL
jgi:hypothetical protein